MPRPTLKPENVVFELGFFLGKLGPAYVAALLKSAAEKPSGLTASPTFPTVQYILEDRARARMHHAKSPRYRGGS
jgi:predicted nucleotide-binding protein